ncbi:MAG: hypothetical protein GX649_11345 [Chloroflexi bacterium]|nr:hypothetical protein [Chloroflexota bacterium]
MGSRRKQSYTALGMLLGTAAGFGLGMVLWIATGEFLYLLIGAMGTAVGLVLGAGIDAAQASEPESPKDEDGER